MNVVVKLASGTSAGPYDIYYDQISPGNLLASGVSYASLASGVTYTVPSTTTSVIVVNTKAVCAGNNTIVQTQQVTPQPTITPQCGLAGIAKLAVAVSCKFAGTAVQVIPPCVRPSVNYKFNFNNKVSVDGGLTYTPFSSSQSTACNAAYQPLVNDGYTPYYQGILGEMVNFSVGSTVYLGQNLTNCDTIPDGYYLTNVGSITPSRDAEVTYVVGGVIQSITTCPYTPPPPPPPVFTTTTFNVYPGYVMLVDSSITGPASVVFNWPFASGVSVGSWNLVAGHVYTITVGVSPMNANYEVRARLCDNGNQIWYTSPPASISNQMITYTFTAQTGHNLSLSVYGGGLIPPTC